MVSIEMQESSGQPQELGIETIPRSEFTRRSISTLAGAFFCVFVTTGFLNAFGVFQEYLFQHQLSDHTEFDIAWIGSFASFLMFFAAPGPGILLDKIGPTIPLLIGAILVPLALFMLSLCTEYYQFMLAQGVLLGIGMSFLTIPGIAMIPRHFIKNRGVAMGATIGGSSLGGVIWPIMLDQILNHHHLSFGWTIRIVAFTAIPLGALGALMVQDVAPEPKPESEKGLPDGTQQAKPLKKKIDLSIAKNVTFILLCIGLALNFLGLFAGLFFIASYATSLGMSSSFGFYLISMANAASLFGRVIPGILADRYGHFNLCVVSSVSSAVIVLCWTAATSQAGLVVWTLAYGFSSGAILSLNTACATQLATPETFGIAAGLVLASTSITSLIGMPISGKLIRHGYLAVSLFAGLGLLLGGAFIVLARLRQCRKVFVKV